MAPSEAQIDLVVDDGSNPPLDLRKVSAVFAELPWIYLEAPGGPLVGALWRSLRDATVLRPGSGPPLDRSRAGRPRVSGERRTRSPQPHRANGRRRRSVPAPSLEGEFRYSRTVAAAPRAGLVALPLDAAALSHSRGPGARFADVRLADRQPPADPVSARAPRRADGDRSRAHDSAPAPPLAAGRLRRQPVGIPADAAGVRPAAGRAHDRDHRARVPAHRPARRASAARIERTATIGSMCVAATTWRHADEGASAPALRLDVGKLDTTEVWLVVDEGDNAALPLDRARLLLPSYRLRYVAPAGARAPAALRPRRSRSPPRYDLALLAAAADGRGGDRSGRRPRVGASGQRRRSCRRAGSGSSCRLTVRRAARTDRPPRAARLSADPLRLCRLAGDLLHLVHHPQQVAAPDLADLRPRCSRAARARA